MNICGPLRGPGLGRDLMRSPKVARATRWLAERAVCLAKFAADVRTDVLHGDEHDDGDKRQQKYVLNHVGSPLRFRGDSSFEKASQNKQVHSVTPYRSVFGCCVTQSVMDSPAQRCTVVHC